QQLTGTPATGSGSLIYNSLLYMTAFALLATAISTIPAEISWAVLEQVALSAETEGGYLVVALVQDAVYSVIIGAFLAGALCAADHVMARNWRSAMMFSFLGVCVGGVGGIIQSAISNPIYWIALAVFGEGEDGSLSLGQVIARVAGWSIFGLFTAAAPGIVMWNFKRLAIGVAGGFLGGVIGGLLFDVTYLVVEWDLVSRVIGTVAIGTLTGLGTGVIENVAKGGWLRVIGGLIAGKQFIIYRNPTFIGSSPQCEIYLFKDPQVSPRHAAVHIAHGGYNIEDLGSGSGTFVNGQPINRVRLHHGDQIQIGLTVFQFGERARTSPQQPQ
ncbi:MAG: FHA domain-containing protein, partial [Planctomycetaceae bacterium]